MKAIMMRETGPAHVLKMEDVDEPAIGPRDVLVKVAAVGVTYHDVVQRNGTMRRHAELPMILGYEIAGSVEQIGAEVKTLKRGDRVCTKAFQSCGMCRYCRNSMETSCVERKPVHGGYAEKAALAEEVCVKIPDNVSYEQACMCGPAVGVALNAVRDAGAVRLGETVLVTGASGGVGLPSVQIARASGARVIALTRSEHKKQALLAAGASEIVVADEGDDFSKTVRAFTQGSGVDVVIDNVGSRVFKPSFKSLALGGRYIMVGQLFREEILINPAFIFFQRAKIQGVGSVRRDQLEDAVALVADGLVKPVIAKTLPLAEVARAHELVEAGAEIGRIVLTP